MFRLLFLLGLILTESSYGFVLISGPYEAKLALTPETPTITFHWNGSLQTMTEKDQLGIPDWESLDDYAYMEQVILLAMKQWNDVPAAYVDIQLVRDDGVTINKEDGVFSIAVKSDSNLSSSAFALPIIEKDEITDCDITLGKKTTSAQTLAYTITHELGHCLGLGHEHANYGAIMGYSRSNSSIRLGADDKAGLIYLYPDPSYSAPPPLPLRCGSVVGIAPGLYNSWEATLDFSEQKGSPIILPTKYGHWISWLLYLLPIGFVLLFSRPFSKRKTKLLL